MRKHHSPLVELMKLQDDINRLMCDLSSQISGESYQDGGSWIPSVDLGEDTEQMVVQVEMPGVTLEHVQISFQNGYLQIRGEKKPPLPSQETHYLCLERSYGRFCRVIYLNVAVDLDNARARLNNGILTIVIPKLKDRRKLEKIIPVEQ
jgi:HSP20 family protein